MARAWNWQTWGRAHDLIHQSDLNGLIGKFGCLEQFRRKKEERATTTAKIYENASGKLASGNAVHAVIHRIMRQPHAVAAMFDADQNFSRGSLKAGFDEEFEKERAGRPVDWYRVNEDKWRDECVSMLDGLLTDMRNHISEVVMAEAGFVYEIDGMWITGSTDLVYRTPGLKRLAIADWKTGAQLPHQIDLDHGWQSGIYGNALRDAYWVPYENVTPREGQTHRDAMEEVCTEIAMAWQEVIETEQSRDGLVNEADYVKEWGERCVVAVGAKAQLDSIVVKHAATRFGEYPERIRHVHLRDYIPYLRGGSKMLTRPEELEWAGLSAPEKSKYVKGDLRGPAWYRVQRAESDMPRLRHLLRAAVSWVRMGRFPSAPGEMCSRCKFREPCLLEGYKPIGEDKRQLELLSNRFEVDGFNGLKDL